MNLTFKICWIEDQSDEMQKHSIEEAVQNSGFEPELKLVRTEEEIEQFARQQENYYDFSLVLLDLNLGNNLRGDELALNVRNSFRSTPILFYSAQEVQYLRKLISDKQIEGVFCAHRENLKRRVEELILDLTPLLNQLTGMRGLAASIVAECDKEFRIIIRHIGEERNLKESVIKAINTEFEKRKNVDISKIKDLNKLLNHSAISSRMLFRVACNLIGEDENNLQTEDIRTIRLAIERYNEHVLEIRNKLAHVPEERTDNGWVIPRRRPNRDLTVQDFKEYRADLRWYLTHIRQLRGHLMYRYS